MMKTALLLASVFALAACSGGTSEIPGEIITSTNMKVTAAVSALTLGDEGCSAPASGPSSSMAADPAGRCAPGAGAPAASGDIVAGGCGGGCRQSSVQISFKATAEGSAALVEIVKVVLLEGTKELETLTPTNPKSWNGSGYTAWDQGVAPSADIRSSYSLSAPAWSKSSGSFSKQYKVRITVKIGDTTTVIDSEAVSREAAVAT